MTKKEDYAKQMRDSIQHYADVRLEDAEELKQREIDRWYLIHMQSSAEIMGKNINKFNFSFCNLGNNS